MGVTRSSVCDECSGKLRHAGEDMREPSRERAPPPPLRRPSRERAWPATPALDSACYAHTMTTRSWVVDDLGETAFEQLAAQLPGSTLQSVLLEVMSRRAAARSPAEVLSQFARDGFCRPAAVDQRTSVAIDGHLLAAADGFEAIELSPVAPLAACSSVALTAQHRVLSALRQTEIVADPTNVLALACALRLRAGQAP